MRRDAGLLTGLNDTKLDDYLQRLEQSDAVESQTGGSRVKDLAEKIGAIRARRARCNDMLAQRNRSGEEQISDLLRRLRQQPHVNNFVGDLLLHDQLVFGINGDLNIVAHRNPGVHCTSPGCRDRSTASSMNFCKDARVKLQSLLLTALIRVPSTASSSLPNKSNSRQSSTNWRNTRRKALLLSRRKSAMVLKSGFRCRSRQITPTLRWVSASRRRLDRIR